MATLALIFFLSLEFFELLSTSVNPYLDLWNWLVFAPMFVFGALLIPFGVFVTRWYWLRRKVEIVDTIRYPHIDLSDAGHRRILIRIALITIIILPLIGLASSKTVHYSSSTTFCGTGCHNVMGPQYTRYQHSSHARVDCADCHIGPGTESLIKAKINGLRQVLSVLTNSYPHPIPAAQLHLRPARETCENCHWPSKYFGDRYFNSYNYRSDEQNSRTETKMILKVGGGDPQNGPPGGIHWHMSVGSVIEYMATDDTLQEIPWVRWRNLSTGESRVYRADGVSGDEQPSKGIMRQLDCTDCHNRGGHRVESPSHLLDVALETGAIDKNLPFIKRQALAALVEPYTSNEQGRKIIAEKIESFYREKYPEIFKAQSLKLKETTDKVLNIYDESFFVEMKVNWLSYPDNVGHKIFPGCFRCHDDKHLNAQGKQLTTNCTSCHDFVSSDDGQGQKIGSEFQHAVLLGKGIHAQVSCRQCHNGGADPDKRCDGACHQSQLQLMSAETPDLTRFEIEADEMFEQVDCEECHIPEKRFATSEIGKECKSCHEDDGDDYDETLLKWTEKLADQRKLADQKLNALGVLVASKSDEKVEVKAVKEWLAESQAALAALSKAGALHNYKAAKKVYKSIIGEAQERIESLETLDRS